MAEVLCNDWPDAPGCERTADLAYTMHFDDIGELPVYWCASCGERAHAMNEAINQAARKRGQDFAQEFSNAIDAAEGTKH